MAEDINQVVLVGRLTRDAELKYTGSGYALCRMGLAVNRRRKSGDQWIEEASFFDIVLWGRRGEALQQYLGKGKQIAVTGQLRQDRWEKDGQSRSRVVVEAQNVQLLGGGGSSGGSNQNRGYPQAAAPGKNAQSFEDYSSDSGFEDDIPF